MSKPGAIAEQEVNVLDLFKLDNRVVLITGGSKGLGKSMATGLAQAGATTVICARHEDECVAAAEEISNHTGQESIGLRMDVTSEREVEETFAKVRERFGRLDVLVNSAGINVRAPITEASFEQFRQIIDVNLAGTWLCCRAAGGLMIDQGHGSVINIGSALSSVGLPERTPYCSSKAGVIGLTKTLALEWAPHRVRCNAICPGPFLTEINRPLLNDPEKTEAVVGRTAFRRWAELHEIRGAALFLASEASSYVTGSALYIDAGWTAQ